MSHQLLKNLKRSPIFLLPDKIEDEHWKNIFYMMISLAKNYNCSFHVIDLNQVVEHFLSWQKLLPRVKPYFAHTFQRDPKIAYILGMLGCGFSCASYREINDCITNVVRLQNPQKIRTEVILSNPFKLASDMKNCRQLGVKLTTFMNKSELDRLKLFWPDAELLMAVVTNPELYEYEFTISKMAAPIEKVDELLEYAKKLDLNIVGLVCFHGTHFKLCDSWRDVPKIASGIVDKMEKAGCSIKLLSLGDGFDFVDSENDKVDWLKFREEMSALSNSLDEYFPSSRNIDVVAQPARYFTQKAELFAFKIMGKRFRKVSLDAEETSALCQESDDGENETNVGQKDSNDEVEEEEVKVDCYQRDFKACPIDSSEVEILDTVVEEPKEIEARDSNDEIVIETPVETIAEITSEIVGDVVVTDAAEVNNDFGDGSNEITKEEDTTNVKSEEIKVEKALQLQSEPPMEDKQEEAKAEEDTKSDKMDDEKLKDEEYMKLKPEENESEQLDTEENKQEEISELCNAEIQTDTSADLSKDETTTKRQSIDDVEESPIEERKIEVEFATPQTTETGVASADEEKEASEGSANNQRKLVLIVENSQYMSFNFHRGRGIDKPDFWLSANGNLINLDGYLDENLMPTTIFGNTCDSLDIVCPECNLPESLGVGDYMVWVNRGAYGTCLMSQFNGMKPPKHYHYIHEDTLRQFMSLCNISDMEDLNYSFLYP